MEAPQRESGFRNIRALTRAERRAQTDKVALEKGRLLARTGASARMYKQNLPDWEMGLTAAKPGAAGWLSDADRFHTDVSGEAFLERKREFSRKQEQYQRRRVNAAEREEARWKRLEEQKSREAERVAYMRLTGSKAKKNTSKIPYDVITLAYDDNLDGERQRYSDDRVRYRSQLRAINLQKHGGTRAGYNILSGQDIPETDAPPEPQRSEHLHLAEEYQRKVEKGDRSILNQSGRPSELFDHARQGKRSSFTLG
eukprot:scaffold7063_cov351-Pinguiococcus_pyrenoidosus.AAC.5